MSHLQIPKGFSPIGRVTINGKTHDVAIDDEWMLAFSRMVITVPSDDKENSVIGHGAIATTAINGFVYIPMCPGVPTGVPTDYPGLSPIVIDSTNNRLYFYSSGAWRNAGP